MSPANIQGIGKKYVQVMLDDNTGYLVLYNLSTKSEIPGNNYRNTFSKLSTTQIQNIPKRYYSTYGSHDQSMRKIQY